MKKTYINPTIETVKIETTHMLALSAEMDKYDEITNEDGVGAREYFFDDYDDEE